MPSRNPRPPRGQGGSWRVVDLEPSTAVDAHPRARCGSPHDLDPARRRFALRLRLRSTRFDVARSTLVPHARRLAGSAAERTFPASRTRNRQVHRRARLPIIQHETGDETSPRRYPAYAWTPGCTNRRTLNSATMESGAGSPWRSHDASSSPRKGASVYPPSAHATTYAES